MPRLAFTLLTILLLPGCTPDRITTAPRLRILGIAQDGGLPHAACSCPNCTRARKSPHPTCVASLALILPQGPAANSIYLIDATPDIRTQLDMLRDLRPAVPAVDRAPLTGLFLTHAHIGHYLGLAFFGFEAVSTQDLPVYCTPRMAAFLRDNGPWSQLVRIGNIAIHETPSGQSVNLPWKVVYPSRSSVHLAGADPAAGGINGDASPSRRGGISVTSLQVPHRDEYSDTVAYIFRASPEPQASGPSVAPAIMYVPDTEPWQTWNPPLPEVLAREHVRTLLLDGTFFSADELLDRGAGKIGHPLMQDSMALLEPLVKSGQLDVYFIHLNHSNPALDPTSAAAREATSRGFHLAREGFELAIALQ